MKKRLSAVANEKFLYNGRVCTVDLLGRHGSGMMGVRTVTGEVFELSASEEVEIVVEDSRPLTSVGFEEYLNVPTKD